MSAGLMPRSQNNLQRVVRPFIARGINHCEVSMCAGERAPVENQQSSRSCDTLRSTLRSVDVNLVDIGSLFRDTRGSPKGPAWQRKKTHLKSAKRKWIGCVKPRRSVSGDSHADHPLWIRKALTEFRLCGNPTRATLNPWRHPRCNVRPHSAHHLLSNVFAITYERVARALLLSG